MKTHLDILKGVRELLTPSDQWTKGQLARDRDGDAVAAWDQDAVCWCLIGATEFAWNRLTPEGMEVNALTKAQDYIQNAIREDRNPDRDWIVDFNDDPKTTHDQILETLDMAIQLAGRK